MYMDLFFVNSDRRHYYAWEKKEKKEKEKKGFVA